MDLAALISACTNGVAPATVAAIISVESAGNPLALSTNPRTTIEQADDRVTTERSVTSLLASGANVDIGLMQINSQHLPRLQLTGPQLLDPCINIFSGTSLLREKFARARRLHADPQQALRAALSAYNTGSLTRGLHNGYVARVLQAAGLVTDTRASPNAEAALRSPIRVPFHSQGVTDENSSVSQAFHPTRSFPGSNPR